MNSRYILRLWAFHQAEGVKLARGTVVDERAEVAPVHVEPFAGRGLDAHVGAAGDGVLPQDAQIVLDDGDPAVVAQRFEALRDHGRAGVRVLLQQLGNGPLPGIDLAGPFAMGWLRRGRIEIFRNRAAADAHMPRDFAQRPLLYPSGGGAVSLIWSGVSIYDSVIRALGPPDQ